MGIFKNFELGFSTVSHTISESASTTRVVWLERQWTTVKSKPKRAAVLEAGSFNILEHFCARHSSYFCPIPCSAFRDQLDKFSPFFGSKWRLCWVSMVLDIDSWQERITFLAILFSDTPFSWNFHERLWRRFSQFYVRGSFFTKRCKILWGIQKIYSFFGKVWNKL